MCSALDRATPRAVALRRSDAARTSRGRIVEETRGCVGETRRTGGSTRCAETERISSVVGLEAVEAVAAAQVFAHASHTRSKYSAKRPSRASPAWRTAYSSSSATSHGGRGGGAAARGFGRFASATEPSSATSAASDSADEHRRWRAAWRASTPRAAPRPADWGAAWRRASSRSDLRRRRVCGCGAHGHDLAAGARDRDRHRRQHQSCAARLLRERARTEMRAWWSAPFAPRCRPRAGPGAAVRIRQGEASLARAPARGVARPTAMEPCGSTVSPLPCSTVISSADAYPLSARRGNCSFMTGRDAPAGTCSTQLARTLVLSARSMRRR